MPFVFLLHDWDVYIHCILYSQHGIIQCHLLLSTIYILFFFGFENGNYICSLPEDIIKTKCPRKGFTYNYRMAYILLFGFVNRNSICSLPGDIIKLKCPGKGFISNDKMASLKWGLCLQWHILYYCTSVHFFSKCI